MIKERKFCELINCTGDIKLVYLITLLDIKEDEFYFPPEPYDSEIEFNVFDLYEEAQKLQCQLKEKDKIIDEAIEYLVKWGKQPDADLYYCISEHKEYTELLEILEKGK